MGRTNPTYRDRLRSLEERWSGYRHTLRRRDREPFDRLWEHARGHADASGFQNPPDPMDAVLLSVCLEQERTIETLAERIDALETRVDETAETNAAVTETAESEETDTTTTGPAEADPTE
ncbi:hypothetical protein [Halodesulfurarchaeum sp.]|uniref:hypothetical protein n=1 Tax=Halodesulfurarchaeum sp. TaxID=1980530 RepID=UPI002FC32393